MCHTHSARELSLHYFTGINDWPVFGNMIIIKKNWCFYEEMAQFPISLSHHRSQRPCHISNPSVLIIIETPLTLCHVYFYCVIVSVIIGYIFWHQGLKLKVKASSAANAELESLRLIDDWKKLNLHLLHVGIFQWKNESERSFFVHLDEWNYHKCHILIFLKIKGIFICKWVWINVSYMAHTKITMV